MISHMLVLFPGRRQLAKLSAIGFALLFLWHFLPQQHDRTSESIDDLYSEFPSGERHVLDDVISNARRAQQVIRSSATANLSQGIEAYRNRRHRDPPPGFDKWYSRALRSNAVIVEQFFDQIYEDLEPFWGIPPSEIRSATSDWTWTLRIRNGKVVDIPQGRFRSRVWGKMIQKFSKELPDMEIAINPLDEPRVIAPWDDVNASIARESSHAERSAETVSPSFIEQREYSSPATWHTSGPIWPRIQNACPPRTEMPKFDSRTGGYIANWTAAKDVCAHQDWASMHGSLIEPQTLSITTILVPIFSDAKMSGYNDILLPSPAYYSELAHYSGKGWFGDGATSYQWHKKKNGIVWRGKATGGKTHEDTFQKFHRQRFVSMLNSSNTAFYNNDKSVLWPFTPTNGQEAFRAPDLIPKWLHIIANVAFTDLLCSQTANDNTCDAISSLYSIGSEIPMAKQYLWKYLPDIDGNGLSGRFRAFMRSNSAPMKATLFKEWHDHRLMPWVHFIPVSISFHDLWAIAGYFLGFGEQEAHDMQGKRIALEGRDWAKKVMRKEDMELYTYRALLEYARICDDRRDESG